MNLFSDLTDSELIIAIEELKEDDKLGIIREESIIRKKCEKICNQTGESISSYIMLVQLHLYKEAANRFYKLLKQKKCNQ